LARTIAISDEVYELLKRSKLPGESFSTVIKRSLHKRNLSEVAGSRTLAREDWAKARERLAEAEQMTSQRLSGKS
jgi:predicted CopG family antitoxin